MRTFHNQVARFAALHLNWTWESHIQCVKLTKKFSAQALIAHVINEIPQLTSPGERTIPNCISTCQHKSLLSSLYALPSRFLSIYLFIYLIIFNCACVSACLHVGVCTRVGQKRVQGSNGARVTGSCVPLGMGARN